jgi:transcriptional regulator with XRE-family HTH domain
MEADRLREILSCNIKRERKKLGLTQEKLAEYADLSCQTVNDIEGCRMWVSDKTMSKLAGALHVEAYQLLVSEVPDQTAAIKDNSREKLLFNLEDRIIRNIRMQFREAIEATAKEIKKET